MRFYVSVGRRGLIFRIGMVATGVMGSLTYWYGSRHRSAISTEPTSRPLVHTTQRVSTHVGLAGTTAHRRSVASNQAR